KKWYLEKYRKLGELYTKKGDSWEFLKGFIRKKGGNYYPINREAEGFVRHYYRRYQQIGGEIWNG
ncbi:MAG: hypothetical protein ABGW77_02200, partial [Campylobacterales bacterium]